MQPFQHDHVRHRRCAIECFVRHLLQRHDRAAAISAVGGNQQLALRVVHAIAQRLGAEAAEDDAVRRADARAGKHRDREFGHERHVDGDAIALLDAQRLQHVRERADLAIQIEVGQRPAIAGLPFPDECGLVAACAANVAIDAVDRHVDLAADEPLGVRRIAPVEHLRPLAAPLELGRKLCPERFWISFGLFVGGRVSDDRFGAEFSGWFENAILVKERGDFRDLSCRPSGKRTESGI